MKKLKIDLKMGFESLEIASREDVTTQYLGRYKSVFKGKGLEFDSYRDYSAEDDAAEIDWKASSRADKLLVKNYVEERNISVFILMDVSNTMLLSSQPKLKCEYAAELASALGYSIVKSGDCLGFATASDKLSEFTPPKLGFDSHSRLLNVLSNPSSYGGDLNIKNALDSLLGYLNQGSLVIIISDFIGLKPGWEESIKLAASKFSLIGLMVRDPIDREISPGTGQLAIADPGSDETLLIEPNIIKPYYQAEVKKEEEHISSVFMDNGADFLSLLTTENFIGKIIELFKMREEKWR